MKHFIQSVLVLLMVVATPFTVAASSMGVPPAETEHVKAEVIEIVDEQHDIDLGSGLLIDVQTFRAKILGGDQEGEIIEIENTMLGNPAYDLWVSQGDHILVVLETLPDGTLVGYLMDYARDTYIYILLGIFALLLVFIGGRQGIKALITLAFTVLLIGYFTLPMLFRGLSPVLLALLTSLIASTVTFITVGGWTKKSFAAIFGAVGGLAITALLSILVSYLANLKGMTGDEEQMLMYIPQAIDFNFRGLLLAGIIIGALGAVMDTTMSIASTMDEIYKQNPSLTMKELINSGMNVGKDVMGTMSNTLILAYAGASIPLFLLLMAYEQPFVKLINMDFLATEVVRSLCGSIGLILAIPITALIAGFLLKSEKQPTNLQESTNLQEQTKLQ